MLNMSSQDTRRKVRLNEKVESRVRGDLYARFGGEYLETYYCKKWQGAGCLAYGPPQCRRRDLLYENGRPKIRAVLPSPVPGPVYPGSQFLAEGTAPPEDTADSGV